MKGLEALWNAERVARVGRPHALSEIPVFCLVSASITGFSPCQVEYYIGILVAWQAIHGSPTHRR